MNKVLLSALLVIALCSCHGHYPTQLTQADSLIERGHYLEADSLLAVYDRHASNSKHDQMYRQLLQMERKFVDGTLSNNDFSMADSISRYYRGQENREEVIAQLCLGTIYEIGGDHPSGLDCFMKAEQMSGVQDNLLLQIWVNRLLGDVYFNQRMFDECIDYYKKSYHASLQQRDTFRIALASFSMGRVYMIKSDVDSILFYFNQTINLAKSLPQHLRKDIIVPAKATLADIYTQLEEYNKASALMTRHPIDDQNWAYWHLAQQHTDSAIFYFRKLLNKNKWSAKVDYLNELSKLEERQGNESMVLTYYKQLNEAKDSLLAHSQVEETINVKAQHERDLIKQERDKAERSSEINRLAICIICVFILLAIVIIYYRWRRYREQKEREIAQGRLLLQEMERQNKQSAAQIERNKQQITLLNQQLQEARNNNDNVKAEKFQLEARLLDAENKQIQTKLQYKQEMQRELEHSPLRERIKLNAGKEYFQLKDEEWLQLATLIDNANDQFTKRLRNLYDNITEYELHICYLVKLDIPSVAIGTMLYKSKAAIGMARQRLYLKLTGKKGTAKDFNNFIQAF